MGMYTCLQFTGLLKEEFVEVVDELLTDRGRLEFVNKEENNWSTNVWEVFTQKYEFARKFTKLSRSIFIPFGAFSAYNLDKVYTDTDQDALLDFDHKFRFSNLIYRTWTFQCDLKDYDHEIKTFLKEVAVNMCEKFVAKVWYESDDLPEVYVFNKEKMKKVF